MYVIMNSDAFICFIAFNSIKLSSGKISTELEVKPSELYKVFLPARQAKDSSKRTKIKITKEKVNQSTQINVQNDLDSEDCDVNFDMKNFKSKIKRIKVRKILIYQILLYSHDISLVN